MTTFKRVCIQDYSIRTAEGAVFELKRCKEYITSAEQPDNTVVVFSSHWVTVPSSIFAGPVQFT